jgi:hypothetical protein
LLATLRTELPRQPTIDFFQTTDFLIDFERAPVTTLDTFTRNWDNEEHRFFDSTLEKSRAKLLTAARSCLSGIARYATIEENDRWQIRTMRNRHDEKFETMWREQAGEIRGFATKVVRCYDELIQRGRSRFPDDSSSASND